jgi:hypothetical protein
MSSTLTVNLHRPQVQKTTVLPETGTVLVSLGDGPMHGSVDVFFDDVAAAKDFIRSLALKVAELEVVSV